METPRLSNTEQEMAIMVALVTGLRTCGGRRDRQTVQVGGRTNGAAMGGGAIWQKSMCGGWMVTGLSRWEVGGGQTKVRQKGKEGEKGASTG